MVFAIIGVFIGLGLLATSVVWLLRYLNGKGGGGLDTCLIIVVMMFAGIAIGVLSISWISSRALQPEASTWCQPCPCLEMK
jgi:hypothetical protein